MTRIEKLGREIALVAIDQAASMGGIEIAIDSYLTNLGDTLDEIGARNRETEALRGFDAVLAEHGIIRP